MLNENSELPLMKKLIKLFFRGSLITTLLPEDVSLMTWDWQQRFLNATLNNDLLRNYPICYQFKILFIKKIIGYLEGKQEIHDDFYSHLCHAMKDNSNDSSYRHYFIDYQDEVIITIKQTNKMVVNGTTGMRTWEAALMLADWALCHKDVFTNKTILELGSGVGFTGITIGKLCSPKHICLTDHHPEVMKVIRDNIEVNFPQSHSEEIGDATVFINDNVTIGAMSLDWNSLEDLKSDLVPDVIIGADIVYDPVILEPLCQVLHNFFEKNSQLEVFIASVVRNEDTFQAFLTCLDKMNFIYEKLPLDKCMYIEWDITKTCLLKIKYCSYIFGLFKNKIPAKLSSLCFEEL